MKIMVKKYTDYLNDNFWNWFGDSKVVDEKGNPLIVYHGTKSSFDIFKPSKNIGNQGENDQIKGMYFTDSLDGANWFAFIENDNRYLKSVYLSLQKPFIVDGLNELKSELNIDKLNDVDKILISKGYDGLIIKRGFYANGGPYKMIIVFNSTQIKSATNNNGDFDINNNNIYEKHNK